MHILNKESNIEIVKELDLMPHIRAPFFFVVVGSQANVGGAASAPIVASAFHPSIGTGGVFFLQYWAMQWVPMAPGSVGS